MGYRLWRNLAAILLLLTGTALYGAESEDSTCPSGYCASPDLHFQVLVPRIGTVTAGSRVAFGAAYQWRAPGELPLDWEVSGLISIRNYQAVGGRIGWLKNRRQTFLLDPFGHRASRQFHQTYFKEKGFSAFADANYFYFPTENFFGLGPDSVRSDRTDFQLRAATYEGVAGFQFNRWLGVSARGGVMDMGVGRGRDARYADTAEVFPNLPGLVDEPDFYRFSSGILADFRDFPGDPNRGGMVGFLFSHFSEKGNSRYQFRRYSLDLRQYLPVEPISSVIALRAFSSVDDPTGGGLVPFYLMETLGGGGSLRGYPSLRFRDRNQLLLSGEFRWEARRSIELAAFYDTGKVFSDLADYNLRQLSKGYGLGLRLKPGATLFVRFDVARSREGTRLHVNLGPAF
jgi:hypothetical protein